VTTAAGQLHYFGASDRGIRDPPQAPLRIQTLRDIFLLEILPFKARLVQHSVSSVCSSVLAPLIDDCYQDYDIYTKYSIALKGDEQRWSCCAMWSYQTCVRESVRMLENCTASDVDSVDSVLINTESHPKSRLICYDYEKNSYGCTTNEGQFGYPSFAMTLVLILGLSAILIAILLTCYAAYMYSIQRRSRTMVIETQCSGCANGEAACDGTHLLGRTIKSDQKLKNTLNV